MVDEAVHGLEEVDSVEIITLMDNYIDVLLRNSPGVMRPPRAINGNIPTDTLLAEHGLSLLVTVTKDSENHCILFDCGYSKIGVPHNIALLGVELQQIETIVISHGHMDHTGALYTLVESIGKSIPLVFHPDALIFPRYFGPDLFPRALIKEDMVRKGIEVVEAKTPTILANKMIAVTGEIERSTEFERGLPNAFVERNGTLEHDKILDDQALVIKLKEKGLVIISGCSHAGIVNTVLYAKKIMGTNRIHAIIGGFHLQGPDFEPIIEKTIAEFKNLETERIIPMHCTGWKAIKEFSDEFPSSFVLNSVGTILRF